MWMRRFGKSVCAYAALVTNIRASEANIKAEMRSCEPWDARLRV